jgi:hypothetical protein
LIYGFNRKGNTITAEARRRRGYINVNTGLSVYAKPFRRELCYDIVNRGDHSKSLCKKYYLPGVPPSIEDDLYPLFALAPEQ